VVGCTACSTDPEDDDYFKDRRLADEEKIIKGFTERPGKSAAAWMALHRDENPRALETELMPLPKRPPYCRSCGGYWGYNEYVFKYKSGKCSMTGGYYTSGVYTSP